MFSGALRWSGGFPGESGVRHEVVLERGEEMTEDRHTPGLAQ